MRIKYKTNKWWFLILPVVTNGALSKRFVRIKWKFWFCQEEWLDQHDDLEKIACPMHKKKWFSLIDGSNLNGDTLVNRKLSDYRIEKKFCWFLFRQLQITTLSILLALFRRRRNLKKLLKVSLRSANWDFNLAAILKLWQRFWS